MNKRYEPWEVYVKNWNEDLLRYGEILTDDEFSKEVDLGDFPEDLHYVPIHIRIRTIKYNNHIYYHKMVSGKVVEVKELM